MEINVFGLLSITSCIYPMLKEQNYVPSGGIVLLLNSYESQNWIAEMWKQTDAVEVTLSKEEKITNRNYQLYLLRLKKLQKKEKIEEFLEESRALHVILAGGVIPEFLERDFPANILGVDVADNDVFNVQVNVDNIKKFKNYAIHNSAVIVRALRLYKKRYNAKENKIVTMLQASVFAWCAYFREFHTEEETAEEEKKMFAAIERQLYFVDTLDALGESVSAALVQYVKSHEDIVIGNVDDVDSILDKAIKEDRAILEKGIFYLVPEKLLRVACTQLLELVSFPLIKKGLFREGYLIANNVSNGNYTTKTLITNVYGYTSRPRFLKLKKELFQSSISIGF